ncbi:MAG: MFS transporter [Cellulosilyticaceae bacterium]
MNFEILKDRNFTLLMFGKITSLIGSSLQSFALSLYVLAKTGSATQFASILAVAMIPQLILSPFAGVLVDWFDRKKMMVILDVMSGVTVSVFAVVLFVTNDLPIGAIYAVVIILGLISTLFQPTNQTVIPMIMAKEKLVDANALNSLIMSLGNVAAPALAGVLYGAFGLKVIFVINAISFFISALSECFIAIPKLAHKREKLSGKAFAEDFTAGIKFTVKQRTIMSIITLAMMLNFALGAFSVGITFVSKQILGVSDFQYGLVESVSVAAMMLASLCVGYLGKKFSVGKNLYLSLLFTGISTAFYSLVVFEPFRLSFSSNLVPYMVMLAVTLVMCWFVGVGNIFVGIYFQSVVPLEYMGRVGTVLGTVCMAAMPLSSMVYGVLFDILPTWSIFIIAAVLVVIPVLVYRNVLLSVKPESVAEESVQTTPV